VLHARRRGVLPLAQADDARALAGRDQGRECRYWPGKFWWMNSAWTTKPLPLPTPLDAVIPAARQPRPWPRRPRGGRIAPTLSGNMTMGFDFTGKRVLVAGGSRGIGRAIALGFVRAGARVSACARGADGLAALAAEGVQHVQPADLADAAQIDAWVAAGAAALGGIDVLVNNASGFGMGDTEEGWKRGLDVDVMATVRASHAALPHLRAARGCIVNTTSISGSGRRCARRPMRR
jgi:hypothetical protein